VQINDYIESINQYNGRRLRRLHHDQHGRPDHSRPWAGSIPRHSSSATFSQRQERPASYRRRPGHGGVSPARASNPGRAFGSRTICSPGFGRAWASPSAISRPWSTPRMPTSSRSSRHRPTSTTWLTWNPLPGELGGGGGAGCDRLFDSAEIPGEIIGPCWWSNTEVAGGLSGLRQGAGRRLVRDHGDHERQ
jgi:hypothetical protein